MEINSSIECQVNECRYHSGTEDYCTLDNILVGKSQATAKSVENTDCKSFDAKDKTY